MYVVIHLCDSMWSFWVEANLCSAGFWSFVYICVAMREQLSRVQGWDPINRCNPTSPPPIDDHHCLRRVWRYQRGNQNPYINEEQITQWPKEKVQKDKQRSTKHTHKTKDRAPRTPLKTGGEVRCSGRISSSCSTPVFFSWYRLAWFYLIDSLANL